ncbi:cytochrome P450 [Sphingobium sp. Sx8-8]|uniref:cytochrome P450 n=1 Tax=Sphingobium sp. Sx8-8 TaxID=2933617 RepID=UPI001F585D9A|nr:cytochrome P450 [Sphingobium sp. Sx8-8]
MNDFNKIRAFDYSDFDSSNIIDIDLDGEYFRSNWENILADWATRPPIYITTDGVPQFVFCARHRDNLEVYLNRDGLFTTDIPKVPGYERFDFFYGKTNVGMIDGAEHRRIRRLLDPSFSAAMVKSSVELIDQSIDGLLDKLASKGSVVDVMSDFSVHLVDAILLEGMLKIKDEQRRAFARMAATFHLVASIPPGGEYPREYIDGFEAAVDAVSALVDERRNKPGNDMISVMVQARDQGDQLTNDELIYNLFAIFAGGLTTTSISTACALLNLARHPDQLQILQDDMDLLPMAIEECLRIHAPGYLSFPRFARQDLTIGGTPVYAGAVIGVSPQAANYDPVVFPDPLRFDVRRNPKNIMTFGTGIHNCVGSRLARFVIQASLRKFMERFPKFRLEDRNYRPKYIGQRGELLPVSIPMRID